MSSDFNNSDFPQSKSDPSQDPFYVDPAFRPAPYEADPDSAAILARQIEHGIEPPAPPELPKNWRKAYDAVHILLNTTREARFNAFKVTTLQLKQGNEMWREVSDAMSDTEDRSQPHRIYYRAEDALNEPPPFQWLVEGLLSRPSLNLLVGDPGTKKTFLALDLAACISLGINWLGRSTNQFPTLFLDEETGLARFWTRLRAALRGHDAPYSTPLYFCSLGGFDVRLESDVKAITESALNFGAKLIVIDPLAGLMQGADENSVATVQPIIHNLRRIAEYSEAAVLLIHHNNRFGSFRGSSALSAGLDLMLSIESEPQDSILQVRTLKSRHLFAPPFCAETHFDNNAAGVEQRFWLTPTDAKPEAFDSLPKSGVLADILDYLSENGQATTPELMAQLSHNAPGTVRNAVHHLMTVGQIQRVNGSSRGTKATFKLVDKTDGAK